MENREFLPQIDLVELDVALRSEHSDALMQGFLTGDWSAVDSLPEPIERGQRVAA